MNDAQTVPVPESGDPTVDARATAVEMRDAPALDAASDWTHFQRA